MRERLENGTLIWFDPDDDGKYQKCLKITGYLSEGGSSLVYLCYLDGVLWTLKEIFPASKASERDAKGNKEDISGDLRELLSRESKNMLQIQNDTENSVMELPFTLGMLKSPAVQKPGAKEPAPCSQLFSLEQYIKGKTLDQIHPSSLMERLQLAQNICSTLEGFHDAGFILCDLKPQNIMVTDRGKVYFLDFATALKTGPDGKAALDGSDLPSTSGYTAIELFDGNTSYLEKSYDIYSAGALLQDFFMPEKIRKIRENQFLHLTHFASVYSMASLDHLGAFYPKSIENENNTDPAVADALSHIMKKCMADDPKQRYQDARELHRAIEGVMKVLESRPESPEDFSFHMLWHACYERWKKRCIYCLNGQLDSLLDQGLLKEMPKSWHLAPLYASDEDGTFLLEDDLILKKDENIYFYGESGSGKSMAAAGIMAKALEKEPVLYLDLSYLPRGESIQSWLLKDMFGDLPEPEGCFNMIKMGSRPLLVILDNLNKVPVDEKETICGQIKDMNGSSVHLIVIGHTEKPKALSSFHAVKCEGLLDESDPIMKIPFFYQKNRELDHRPGKEDSFTKVYAGEGQKEKKEYEILDLFYREKAKEYPDALRMAYIAAEELVSKTYLTKKDLADIAVKSGVLEADIPFIEDLLCSKFDVLQKGHFDRGREEGYVFSHDRLQEFFSFQSMIRRIKQAIYLKDPSTLSGASLNKYMYGHLWYILGKDELESLRLIIEEHPEWGDSVGSFCSSIAEYMLLKSNSDLYTEEDLLSWAKTGVLLGEERCLQIMAISALRKAQDSHEYLEKGISLCQEGMSLGQNWAYSYMGAMALKEIFSRDGFITYIDLMDDLRLKFGHLRDSYTVLWRLRGVDLPSVSKDDLDISVSTGLEWLLKDSSLKPCIDHWRYSLFPQNEYALEVLTFFAERGEAREALMLASLYYSGCCLVEMDLAKADHWYQKAKENAFLNVPRFKDTPAPAENDLFKAEMERRKNLEHIRARGMMGLLMKKDQLHDDVDRLTAEYMIQRGKKDPYLYQDFQSTDEAFSYDKRRYAERQFQRKSKDKLLNEITDYLVPFIDESKKHREHPDQILPFMQIKPEIVIDKDSFKKAKLSSSGSVIATSIEDAEWYGKRGEDYYGAFDVCLYLKNTKKDMINRVDELTVEAFDGDELIGEFKEIVHMYTSRSEHVSVLVDSYGAAYHTSKVRISVRNILLETDEDMTPEEKSMLQRYWKQDLFHLPLDDLAAYAFHDWTNKEGPDPKDQ